MKCIEETKDQGISYMDIWSSEHNGKEEYTKKIMKQNVTTLVVFSFICHCHCRYLSKVWSGNLWDKKSLTKGAHPKEYMTYKMGIKISQKFMISGLVCKMQIFL